MYCIKHAPSYLLVSLDALYHGALRFITGCRFSTHHCDLYKMVGWSPLNIRRQKYWYLFIYKAILGYLPSYLCSLIKQKLPGHYSLRSKSIHNLCVPFAITKLGKNAFKYAAASDWNLLQTEMKLKNLVSCGHFKYFLNNHQSNLMVCKCF